MLLPLYCNNSVLPPKSLTNLSSPFFITHKTLNPQNPVRTSKFFIQCSTPQNPQATSKSENVPKSAIRRIADKLRSLGIVEQSTADKTLNPEPGARDDNSPGEIFIPISSKLPKYRVGHTFDASWSTPENPVPQPGSGPAIVVYNELREEVNKQKQLERKPKEKVPSLAELKLSAEELRRLRTIGIGLKKKLKVGKAGITEGIVNGIHERWRNVEVVKIVCEDICRLNMKRTHDLLERKTGGLVVWRSGSKIILYRGPNYRYPYFLSDNSSTVDASLDAFADARVDSGGVDTTRRYSSGVDGVKPSGLSVTSKRAQPALVRGVGSPDKVRFQLPGEEELVEEADRLLDGLGPRFKDWWGYDPQPVDADILPAVVPGYRRPFRLLPYGVQPKLTNDEMTTLKRLGRPLPCHFALGRNRKHQGLAAAIVKLWEKCEIAKIAIKRGVQNTNSGLMAEELKWLTGGTLISRDKEFIVLYRGKDFLPPAVSSAIEERRKYGTLSEKQSTELSTSIKATKELKLRNMECNSEDDVDSDSEDEFGSMDDKKNIPCYKQKDLRSSEAAIRRTSIKLSMALEKKAKAEKLLAELEEKEIPQQPELDKEGITEEERYMLRKVGLRMRAFLLMGRRGVFDGTVENMHLHWKYRELVKVISKQKSIEAVYEEARTLEGESGGILVAVERVSKGHAIIMYRGKNYERPGSLRPKTLLTKRQALKRSIEAQRRESLKLHVLELTRNITKLKFQLAKDEVNTMQSVDESVLPLVKEEIDSVQSAEYVRSHTDFQPVDNSQSVIPTLYQVTEARNEQGADTNCMKSNDPVDAKIESVHATERDKLIDFYSTNKGNEMRRTEFESSSESVSKQTQQEAMGYSAIVNAEDCSSGTEPIEPPLKSAKNIFELSVPVVTKNGWNEMPSRVSVVNAEDCPSDTEPIQSPHESAKSGLETSAPVVSKNVWNEMLSRVVNLSNRDRLILRKQALKMKKRPVLAVGRSNIVTGVAKAIKAHFLKHPLAIVNVKSRAKGTSVQEVVSKLQEATGAVLVSQEPSKVILYRGWGAKDDFGHKGKKNGTDKTAIGREAALQPAVSPELLAAIRLECGLQDQQGHETTPVAGL